MLITICDDNKDERDLYYNKILKILNNESIVAEIQTYSDGKQLLFEFDKGGTVPDIIYLDVLMPNINGIDVANQLRSAGFEGEIIFLTNSDEYWKNAFDVHAYHYIVKNDCSEEYFVSIFKNAINSVLDKNEDYILFNSCGETLSIKIKDIYYFEVTGRIVVVVYSGGRFEFYSTLSKLEEQLSSRNFIRIHKSFLVSKNYIIKTYYDSVILKDNTKLPVGRTYKNIVNKIFNKGSDK